MDPHHGCDGQVSFDPVKALVAYHAALNAHDVVVVETLMAADVTYHSATLGVLQGRDAIVGAFRRYFAAHGDHSAWDDVVKAVGPLKAHAIWQLAATNRTSNEKSHRRGEETVTFDGDGKILMVEVVDYT